MNWNNHDPDHKRNQELHQLRGYRGQAHHQQDNKDQSRGSSHMAQQKIDSVIDQLSDRIPGGHQYAQQAKDATATALHYLEYEAEKISESINSLIHRLFGGR